MAKPFDLKDLALKAENYYPKTLKNLQWLPNTNSYSYVDKESIVIEEFSSKTKKTVSLSDINESLLAEKLKILKALPSIKWHTDTQFDFWNDSLLIRYHLDEGEITILNTIPDHAENIDYIRPEKIAYTINNNLYITINHDKIRVTFDSIKTTINGGAVHRNEFGITKGTFWSPTTNKLAFYQKDESMVSDFPVLDISNRPATIDQIKYPMAGMKTHQVRAGIYDLDHKKTIWLEKTRDADHYLPGVTWSPDEKYIYINILDRGQKNVQLTRFDAATGRILDVLFEESHEKYVEPSHGLYFNPQNDQQFIWISRNEGWNHLYLYQTDGTFIKKLIEPGEANQWEVTEFDGFSSDGKKVYFSATKESPIQIHYYSYDIEQETMSRVTRENGTHNIQRNHNDEFFLDEYSSFTIPHNTQILDFLGNSIQVLHQAEDPLLEFDIGNTKTFTLKNSHHDILYSRMILPYNFDSQQKYPVIVYVYGGPHAQLVTNSWLAGASLFLNYMASRGYIVFTLDNRGSEHRGLDFEQATYGQLGTKEIEDQLVGVEYLKSLPYVDQDRLGVHGWSYGGFMTTSLMTRTPDIFKVGVAGGAVIDWRYYEIMYTERYMDHPENNKEGYDEANLLNYVTNLKGKLLQVHGTSDPVVLWQHTLMYAKKAAEVGVDLDYYPYLGHPHHVHGADRFHLYKKIIEYFDQNI